jgi:hypothetical protein
LAHRFLSQWNQMRRGLLFRRRPEHSRRAPDRVEIGY